MNRYQPRGPGRRAQHPEHLHVAMRNQMCSQGHYRPPHIHTVPSESAGLAQGCSELQDGESRASGHTSSCDSMDCMPVLDLRLFPSSLPSVLHPTESEFRKEKKNLSSDLSPSPCPICVSEMNCVSINTHFQKLRTGRHGSYFLLC